MTTTLTGSVAPVTTGSVEHGSSKGRRGAILATVCVAVFVINLDTTIVNVALPDLGRQLQAGTGTLQWVVDAYNLAFAALVLAGGSIGDRLGRRPALIVGLIGFALSSAGAAMAGGAGALVTFRALMGCAAALIYPTTLSIIANTFPDRAQRAKAIGVWGAVTGIGVAVGPVAGGALLTHFAWQSVFVALVPVAVLAAALSFAYVPESRSQEKLRTDLQGLATSSLAIGSLVYSFIEAPTHGWLAARTLGGFAIFVAGAVAFVIAERRADEPMIDLSLFRMPAFSAASASVTVAFFALFGFIFIVTQYMQLLRGWGPLSAGLRTLPVAASIALGSAISPRFASRLGARYIVMTGLVLLGSSFAWIATSAENEPYTSIAFQMLVMGLGLGLTTAPATESVLSVLPPAKAGLGSAVNDATREAGGTLGVAVVGSVFTTAYLGHLSGGALKSLPVGALHAARTSVASALVAAHDIGGPAGSALQVAARSSFMTGFHAACVVAAAICAAGAIGARSLPGRTQSHAIGSGLATAGIPA
jgi:EmrB/QacA subfamily drug resistance transporter